MSLPIEKHRYTVTEYLSFEHDATERHEYRDGEILAMAGGSYNHSLIAMNTGGELRQTLKGKPCRVLDSNLRVRIPRTPLYTYPDAMVICGQPQFDPSDVANQTVTNPRIVIEVLSPSTEAYDRGAKFTRYRQLESLEEYILISQDAARVEGFYRQSDGSWLFTTANELGSCFRIRSLEVELPLSELYAGVTFPPVEAVPA